MRVEARHRDRAPSEVKDIEELTIDYAGRRYRVVAMASGVLRIVIDYPIHSTLNICPLASNTITVKGIP